MKTSLIVAVDQNDAIGRGNDLPWYLPSDLRRFKELTTGNVVILGSRTHDSIVGRLGHSLPNRISIVCTRGLSMVPRDNAVFVPFSIARAIEFARAVEAFAGGDEVFVIGGARVYREALPLVERLYVTRVQTKVPDADTHMSAGWLEGFDLAQTQVPELDVRDQYDYTLEIYDRRAP